MGVPGQVAAHPELAQPSPPPLEVVQPLDRGPQLMGRDRKGEPACLVHHIARSGHRRQYGSGAVTWLLGQLAAITARQHCKAGFGTKHGFGRRAAISRQTRMDATSGHIVGPQTRKDFLPPCH